MLTRRSLLAAPLAAPLAAENKRHVVFVTGDDEYRSEYSMPAFARILEKHHEMRTSIAYARPDPGTPDNIEGLEALESADLAVFFLRWRRLPQAQFALIEKFLAKGKPMVGLRTTTHAFQYPKAHPLEKWNDGFGRDVFGQKWFRHHGHMSTTRVTKTAGRENHPILNGIAGHEFTVPSWLYVVEPLEPGCDPLLTGHAINPQNGRDYGPQSVAWTRAHGKARVFFTTLGHPLDFTHEPVRKLLINGIFWAMDRKIPKNGAKADWVEPYNPPESGIRKKS